MQKKLMTMSIPGRNEDGSDTVWFVALTSCGRSVAGPYVNHAVAAAAKTAIETAGATEKTAVIAAAHDGEMAAVSAMTPKARAVYFAQSRAMNQAAMSSWIKKTVGGDRA